MGLDEENKQNRKGWNRNSNSALEPPHLNMETDLSQWRRDVSNWVDLISTAAKEGTDKAYQTVYETMARQLYSRALRPEHRSVVDEAQAKGEINYCQANQIQGLKDIVNLIAVDPPIAIVTLLISSFNKVTSCSRRNDENLNRFVDRFRDVASEHLMYAGASSSSQIGEVLAIIMLNNAKLEDRTLTNAKMQLIGMAKSRKKEQKDREVIKDLDGRLSFDAGIVKVVRKLKQKADVVATLRQCPSVFSNSERATRQAAFHDAVKSLLVKIDKVEEIITSGKDFDENISGRDKDNESDVFTLFADPHKYTLQLDDAVSVLRSLAMSTNTSESGLNRQGVQSMLNKNIQKAMLAFSKQNKPSYNSGSSAQYSNRNNKVSSGRIAKSVQTKSSMHSAGNKTATTNIADDNFCYDCGAPNEKRGHECCPTPSFLTLKKKEESASKSNNEKPEGDQFFRAGSNKKQ